MLANPECEQGGLAVFTSLWAMPGAARAPVPGQAPKTYEEAEKKKMKASWLIAESRIRSSARS
jgi:hypothetical protein